MRAAAVCVLLCIRKSGYVLAAIKKCLIMLYLKISQNIISLINAKFSGINVASQLSLLLT